MPLISGGIYKAAYSKSIIEKLIHLTNKQLFDRQITINNELNGYAYTVGCQSMESSAEKISVFKQNKSVLLGRLFSKNYEPFDLQGIDIDQIIESQGHSLSEQFWGRYILVHFDPTRDGLTIYRDPQGLSTLFYMPIENGVIFSSEVSLLYDALPSKPELNWEYLTTYLLNAHHITTATPFRNLMECPAGNATFLSAYGSIKQTPFWDPLKIRSSFITDESAFEEEIYHTFTACTATWARGAQKISLELSGGLDSSSVLSALKKLPHEVELASVNYYNSQVSSSNEIAYAANIAEIYNVPLKAIDCSAKPFFKLEQGGRKHSKPTSLLFNTDIAEESFANIQREDEIMCGQGGDHLFLSTPPVESIADYFFENKFWRIQKKINEIGAYHRMPHLKILRNFFRTWWHYLKGSMNYIQFLLETSPWMNDSFVSFINRDIFKPIFWERLKNIHPAKARHIFAIYQATLYIDRGYAIPGKPVLNPMLSQPLVELALSVPSYQSYADGHNRILFRRAMNKHHKGDFIWRKSKAETSGVIVLAFRNQYDEISQLLLEGRFVREGLLNKDRLEGALNALKHGKTENSWPIMNLIAAEMWLQNWNLRS